MAFDKLNIAPLGASLTSGDVPTSWSYISAADALATIRASGYFNTWTDQLSKDDFLYIVGTDGADLVIVTSATGATTVTVGAFITAGDIADGSITTAKIAALAVTTAKLALLSVDTAQLALLAVDTAQLADNAVTTAKITDANISLAKLSAGITPSHVTKYAATYTTTGGAAAEAITVAGVLATDIVFAEIKVVGTTPRTILTVIPTTDTITVTFSGDPSNDHVIFYKVIRAAA